MPTAASMMRRSVGFRQAVGDELTVDLQNIEGQVLQVVEAPESGPEIIEGE
jgi:hypothetical protein